MFVASDNIEWHWIECIKRICSELDSRADLSFMRFLENYSIIGKQKDAAVGKTKES